MADSPDGSGVDVNAASGPSAGSGLGAGSACAVCFEELPHVPLPCCGREGATAGYCRRCIEIICEEYQGVGRCPTCRQYIQIDGDGRVSVADRKAKCLMLRR